MTPPGDGGPPGRHTPRLQAATPRADPAAAELVELARQGRLEIQQDGIFQPIFLRAGVPDMEAGA